MTDEEFREYLDQLGGDLESWPAALRDAGLSLLERSGPARDLLAETLVIEDALRAPEPPPPPDLAARIIAAALARDDGARNDGTDEGDGDDGHQVGPPRRSTG